MNFFTAIAVLALLLTCPVRVRAQATQFVLTAQPQTTLAGVTMAAITGEFRNASNVLVSTTAAATLALVTNYSETRSGAQLTFVSVDSGTALHPGPLAIDGNLSTFWQTSPVAPVPPLPHTLIFDVGSLSRLIGVTYWTRQDGQTSTTFANYEVYVSADGTTWGSAVKTGTFHYTLSAQSAPFPAVFGRYVKLVELTEITGFQTGAAAEVTAQRTTTGLGALTGTLTKNAVAGVATFNNIALTTSGTYVVQVTSPGIASAQSVVFTIAENPPGTPGNVRATPEPY